MRSTTSKQELARYRSLYFIFILLSNATVYLWASSDSAETVSATGSSLGEEYVSLKIQGEAKTILAPNVPFALISRDKKIVIKNVFVEAIDHSASGTESYGEPRTQSYLVHVHKSQLRPLMAREFYLIYPSHTALLPRQEAKRISYEITY